MNMDDTFYFDTDFGELIRQERKEQGLTMKELAFNVGVTEHTISRYERGTRKLTYDMANALAQSLGYGVHSLLYKYDKYTEHIPSWFLGSADEWEKMLHSPFPLIKDDDEENAFEELIEELGYTIKHSNNSGCTVVFPDGYRLHIDATEQQTVKDKSADYIKMLFTQLRYDHRKKFKRAKKE
jgi:transcriptional regulator with XRE-family HTH domain